MPYNNNKTLSAFCAQVPSAPSQILKSAKGGFETSGGLEWAAGGEGEVRVLNQVAPRGRRAYESAWARVCILSSSVCSMGPTKRSLLSNHCLCLCKSSLSLSSLAFE